MKERKITVQKAAVKADIDSITWKFGEASGLPEGRQLDAVMSDCGDDLDGNLVERHIEYRDALLRKRMQAYLAEEEILERTSDMDTSMEFEYDLVVDDDFRDITLRPLAMLIHGYLVSGSLVDWFNAVGNGQYAASFAGDLSRIEEDIDSILRVPSRRKRPLQPFGPAKKGGVIW